MRVTPSPRVPSAGRVPTEAQRIFDVVAAMGDVPFGFLEEGCIHRAHVVCKRLEERGIESEKLIILPHGADLVMTTPRAKLGYTVVWYHESPCVTVDGKKWVVDPSVADRPLTVDEWRKTMRPAVDAPVEVFVMPRFAYGLEDRKAPPTTWRAKDVASALKWNDDWRESAAWMEESGFYEQLPKLARGILND